MPPKFKLNEHVLYGSHTATGFKENDVVFRDGRFKGSVLRVNKDGTIRFKLNGTEISDVSPERFQAVEVTITEVEKLGDDVEPIFGKFIAYKVKPDNPLLDPMIARENELTRLPPRRSTRGSKAQAAENGSATHVWGSQ